MVKNPLAEQEMQETQVWFLGREDPLEKGMAIHYSILAWRISWTEEPGGLQSMGFQRVGHNWATEHIVKWRKALEMPRDPVAAGECDIDCLVNVKPS